MDKGPGKNFNLQQRIGEEQQSDSNTNYTYWYDGQSINSGDNQQNNGKN